MVTLKEINLAINAKLKSLYSSTAIQSMDIKEGFVRPCFYVEFDTSTKSPFMSVAVDRDIHVIIYYFPSDATRYKQEVMGVQEILEVAFNHTFTIKEGFIVYPDELSSEVVDGVLHFSFDITYTENLEKTDVDVELMTDLDLNI